MKSTKKSLLLSTISLVLCFAMLLGTTWAWFTDEVTSGSNRIVAGNLDIDLLMDKGGEEGYVSIAGGQGDIFKEADKAQNSNTTLWEPGKTQFAKLAVENKGNLAVKYTAYIDVTDEGLVGSLEYALISSKAPLSTGDVTNWTAVKAISGVITGDVVAGRNTIATGVLDEIAQKGTQNERDYVLLAVHMKEEAGNEYQGKDAIIDVTIVATQKDAEKDAFGPDYDASAQGTVPEQAVRISNSSQNIAMTTSDSSITQIGGSDASGVDKVEIKSNESAAGYAEVSKAAAAAKMQELLPSSGVDTSKNREMVLYLNVDSRDRTESSITYDIDVKANLTYYDDTGNVQSLKDQSFTGLNDWLTATINTEKNLVGLTVTHNSQEMTPMSSATDTPTSENGGYWYDPENGTLIIKSKTFSPFEVSVEIPLAVATTTTGDIARFYRNQTVCIASNGTVTTYTSSHDTPFEDSFDSEWKRVDSALNYAQVNYEGSTTVKLMKDVTRTITESNMSSGYGKIKSEGYYGPYFDYPNSFRRADGPLPTIILDLNGKTINFACNENVTVNWPLFFFNCNFTIQDTSKEKTGIFQADAKYAVLSHFGNGTLTIEGGKYVNVNPNKSDIYPIAIALNANGVQDENGYYPATMVLKGGTFYSVNAQAFTTNVAEGYHAVNNGDGTTSIVPN